ncbi:MAG: peptidoglycan editing factor PgeF [Myxococcales bacterium]|nr:MAG: peptidoglycan editing factor PgeF [Myxococcales bacterium]
MRNVNSQPVLLRSKLFDEMGISHAFSTRQGGFSKAPFDSLNLARSVGDEAASVEKNYASLAQAVGYETSKLYELSQVHSDTVVVVDAKLDPVQFRSQQGDALISQKPTLAVAVRTADCVPLLFASEDGSGVAAVHAGWRGVRAQIVLATISRLQNLNVQSTALRVAIGPHIRSCCFEVGGEVVQHFSSSPLIYQATQAKGDKFLLDLKKILLEQISRAGIKQNFIDDVGGCTMCEPQRFFSYRRDGQASGRQLSVILPRAHSLDRS